MDVTELLRELGGVSTRAPLVRIAGRTHVDAALAAGAIVALARDRYALAEVDDAVALAHRVSGVLSHSSAALHHGWAVKAVPERPHVTVRRKRNLSEEQRRLITPHFADVDPADVAGPATGKVLTLQQCLRTLPFDEALAIADSALRVGDETSLRLAAKLARGPGSRQVRRVAAEARSEPANPFESVLRAITKDVPGLSVEPQRYITDLDPWVRPDLVDVTLGMVLEADSFEWHGGRAALRRDARRYDLLVAAGWIVLRFAWEDVMFDPDFVRQVLIDVVRRVQEQAQRACPRCGGA
jgi:very-short-patch-repair endonuclease